MGNLLGLGLVAGGALLVWVGITGKFDGIVAALGIQHTATGPATGGGGSAGTFAFTGGSGGAPAAPIIGTGPARAL